MRRRAARQQEAAVPGAERDRGGAGRRERVLFAAAVERDEPGGGEGADHGAPAEGGVRRSSDGRPGGAGQQGGGGGEGRGVGAKRGVVGLRAGDCDVPRGDRRADVVAVKERGREREREGVERERERPWKRERSDCIRGFEAFFSFGVLDTERELCS